MERYVKTKTIKNKGKEEIIMKKIMSTFLAMLLVFSMTLTAYATDDAESNAETTGTITINGVTAGTSYKIYKLAILESYKKGSIDEEGKYSYKVDPTSPWSAFFDTPEAKLYVSKDNEGYLKWNADEEDATVAKFAQIALKYAKDNNVANNGSYSANSSSGTEYKFDGLDLGWYLIDSNAGALCSLKSTDPNAHVIVKNGVPTVEKQVQEDLSNAWGDTNTADIGQVVNFRTITHVAAGAENYVLHDKMTHFNFVQDLSDTNNLRGVTSVVYVKGTGEESTLNLGEHYTVNTNCTDGCTFEVEFKDEFVSTIKKNDRLFIYYNAMLNRYATAGKEVVAGKEQNINESWMGYGEDNHHTTHDTTITYTFSFDIVKTDAYDTLLDGAEFRIYDSATGGNEIAVVLLRDEHNNLILDDDNDPMYRRARADEDGVAIQLHNGKVTIIGLDNGDYYLEETKAPAGYNKITSRQLFTIADGNLDAVFSSDGEYATGSGVHVINKTGTKLPETGAAGTTMFITFGMVVVLATGVLLVTKKRMSMIVE